MTSKLQDTENKERKRALQDEFKSTVWAIVHAETALAFLKTEEARSLEGSAVAEDHAKKYEQLLEIKKAELNFLAGLIKS